MLLSTVDENEVEPFLRSVAQSQNSALLLDYDGTLAPFSIDRKRALPYAGVTTLLQELVDTGRTRVVIISGRNAYEVGPLLGVKPCPEIWGSHGLQRLLPLFAPFDFELLSHLREQQHWHGDETRWLVFASTEGKVGHQWWLWLVLSAEVAVFTLAAGRSHDVPEGVLGDDATGIFNADRYTAYPAMKQVQAGQVILALCWAHQRRDFIEAERGRPESSDQRSSRNAHS